MTKSEKRRRMLCIIDALKCAYPDATCALEYGGDPWRLLIMGRLSAQCTDKKVNEVSRELFRVYPTPEAMAEADLGELEKIIKPCGLYRMKAKNLKEASSQLIHSYGGELPDNMDELLKLSGVGRKIANLLLGDIFSKPAIVCDTHCIRICARLGMYPESLKDPAKIEFILRELIPADEGSDFCHRIVMLGRDTCSSRSPRCDRCPLAELCERRRRESKRK